MVRRCERCNIPKPLQTWITSYVTLAMMREAIMRMCWTRSQNRSAYPWRVDINKTLHTSIACVQARGHFLGADSSLTWVPGTEALWPESIPTEPSYLPSIKPFLGECDLILVWEFSPPLRKWSRCAQRLAAEDVQFISVSRKNSPEVQTQQPVTGWAGINHCQ